MSAVGNQQRRKEGNFLSFGTTVIIQCKLTVIEQPKRAFEVQPTHGNGIILVEAFEIINK